MIKDPFPFIWTAPKNGELSVEGHIVVCPWSRYMLPCATNRKKCKGCYMYQKYAHPKRLARDGVKVVHICDKCGQEIASTPLWVRIRTRSDRTVTDAELCLACAGEVLDWLEKKE